VKPVRKTLLAAMLLSVAAPVHAQPAAVPTPEDDLRCAAWAAIVLGLNRDDPEVASAFGMALAWFVARYEGATGNRFEQAMTAEFLDGLAPQLETIETACRPRMQEMGSRFTDWGNSLQIEGR
jgi:hypothetical protein